MEWTTLLLLWVAVVRGKLDYALDTQPESLEDEYQYDVPGPADHVMVMTPADQLRNCGTEDICPVGELGKLKLVSGRFPGQEKLCHDYKTGPYTCHCDPDCYKYGDCCIGLVINGTGTGNPPPPLRPFNPWKCNFLENHGSAGVWALMMSECPEGTEDSETNELCTAEIPITSVTPNETASTNYLLHLPIYSNKSQVLYKNIYCARCHGERTESILKYTLRMNCNREFSPEARATFLAKAKYTPGRRTWRHANVTCHLGIEEFEDANLERLIPSVRYCGQDVVASCRPGNTTTSERIKGLCSSYSQHVTLATGRIYKNPHCFLCHTAQADEVKPKTLSCYSVSPFHRGVRPGSDQPLDGAGLNFLFDFNVFNENQWVGYDMLCHEDEVWDYVRHQCHPMVCGKGHVLIDGACQLEGNATAIGRNSYGEDEHNHEPQEDLKQEPECFRILIHYETEFTRVKDKNGTLAVNLSTGGWIFLDPNEYEIWNETTVSICAKFLHRAFESRFSPVFNYLSVALVGLSVGFLFLHILLYTLIPKLRNLPSKNLFCLTLSLFVSQFVLLLFITATEIHWICVTAAIVIHYFFLSAFFWMNAMSFDIWRTFSGQSLMLRGGGGGSGRGSFLKYSCFSWGVPLLIVSAAVAVDFGLAGRDIPYVQDISPGYGQTGLCWISQRLPLFIFFALPVALVILSNLVLFSLTARAICIQNKESNRVLTGTKDSAKSGNQGKGGRSSDEVLLKLYVKLALIMGLTWILGFISAFLLWDWLWYAFVVLNGLQGTFIFFAFDFKWRTLGLIQERLGLRSRKESTNSASASGKPDMTRRGTSTSVTSIMANNVILPVSLGPAGEKNRGLERI